MVGLVLLAGCSSSIDPAVSPTQSPEITSPAPVTHNGSLQPATRPCPEAISFWNLPDSTSNSAGWSANEVSAGFYSPGTVDFFNRTFFVVYQNDTILGVEPFWSDSGAVHVDGFTIPLDNRLTGTHTIRVVVYADTNENQEFDRETDRPCYYKGSINQAGPKTINFSSNTATETGR